MDKPESQTELSNPNTDVTDKKKKKDGKNLRQQFEFCEVCKLNHNQGRKHIYFPNHKKALSALLSHFQSKLSDVRFFLKNPITLWPEHASRNRLWCIFCNDDIIELGSTFSCGKAIVHFASEDHMKKAKAFLWKYGGGMDRLDVFCISDADLAKWEQKSRSLKTENTGEGSRQMLIGPSNDIHYNLNSSYLNTLGMTVNCHISNDILPLQSYTKERPQVSRTGISSASGVRSELRGMCLGTDITAAKDSAGFKKKQGSSTFDAPNCLSSTYLIDGHASSFNNTVYPHERMRNIEENFQGLPNLSQISSSVGENSTGNVHTGAPPPWLDGTDKHEKLKEGLHAPSLPGRSSKLNPKRVGAAWAERRKIGQELERNGEVNSKKFDSNWLPNFGRVWQSGSRKESKKEFQTENKGSHKDESQSDRPLQLQPYVSKRMRSDISK